MNFAALELTNRPATYTQIQYSAPMARVHPSKPIIVYCLRIKNMRIRESPSISPTLIVLLQGQAPLLSFRLFLPRMANCTAIYSSELSCLLGILGQRYCLRIIIGEFGPVQAGAYTFFNPG